MCRPFRTDPRGRLYIDASDAHEFLWDLTCPDDSREEECAQIAASRLRRALRRALTRGVDIELPVVCGPQTRRVTIHSDGRISTEHPTSEVRSMLALQALGQPPCPCVSLQQHIIASKQVPEEVRSKLLLDRKSVLHVLEELVLVLRRVREKRASLSKAASDGSAQRLAELQRLAAEVQKAAKEAGNPNLEVEPPAAVWERMKLVKGCDYAERAIRTAWFYPMTRDRRYAHVLLGLGALHRARTSTWYAREPNGLKHLILAEAAAKMRWRGKEHRDCIVLRLNRTTRLRGSISRVLVGADGAIAAKVYPVKWALDPDNLAYGVLKISWDLYPEFPQPPTRIIPVDKAPVA